MDKTKIDEFLRRVGLPPVDEAVGKNFTYSYRRRGDSEERTITGQIVGYDVTYQTISIISPALSGRNACVFCLTPSFASQIAAKWYFSPGGSEPPQIRSACEVEAANIPTGTLKILYK
ncbi:MAG: hypothetical protein BWY51_00897 [Parcubacteria group bacterium ADurb.Bin316]|nr:MAG: hypothetical protein BWY51_00897 [Parcubacteria group bacterium ADurb.Bin316]